MAALGLATGPAKLKAVTEIITKLSRDDSSDAPLSLKDRSRYLEELKIYSRAAEYAEPMYSTQAIHTLARLAFNYPCLETNLGGLRVLANALLLKPTTRQMLVDMGFHARLCRALQTESWEEGFLLSRILLLLTYGTTIDIKALVEKNELAERLVGQLDRHAKQLNSNSKGKVDPMKNMALIETTRVLFNVTHQANEPKHAKAFAPAVPHIVALLMDQEITVSRTVKPLDGPIGPLVNVLLNLDLKAETSLAALYPADDPISVASKLKSLLLLSLGSYLDHEIEAAVQPLVGVIRMVYAYSSDATKDVMRGWFLPSDEDRKQVLGRGTSLSAKILKASMDPIAPGLGTSLSQLLYECSDLDASKFIENVGFGIAVGYLTQNNIPIPPSYADEFAKFHGKRAINPVTGQFIDSEKPIEVPEMTQEEKEREAERLFVLFERLKKTGVMNVQNPVEHAINSGRYRELKDDEVEELD